jgi:uncharacterized membrane protein
MIAATLIFHVFCGISSLISGLFVLFLKKGTSIHNRIGWFYFAAMSGVFLTSIIVSIYRLNFFLVLIGFFSFYLVHTGIRYRFVKSATESNLWDRTTTIIYGFIYLFLIGFSIYAFIKGATSLGIILSAFGLIGISLWKTDLKYFVQQKNFSAKHWLGEHIGRMIGSFIAAVTAFAVNNIHFEPGVVVWLAPTLLGFPLIMYFNKKYLGSRK